VTLTQQWQCLNLTRNSFYILFLAKCIVSCRQIISSRLYVSLKKTCSLTVRALLNIGEWSKKLKCWLYENTQNASRAAQNALGATYGPRVCGPGLHGCEIALKQIFAPCKIFWQGTLLVTNFTNLCKHIDKWNKR